MAKQFSITKKRAVWDKTKGLCYYCGIALDPFTFHVDHKDPKCNGGSNEIENLAPSCATCNTMKGGQSLERLRFNFMRRQIKCPSFSSEQLKWLADHNVKLPFPKVTFYFEELNEEKDCVI